MDQKFLNKKAVKFIVISAVCLLLVFWNPKEFFNPIRKFFLSAAYPLQKTFYLTSRTLSASVEFLGSISELKNENEKLIKENNSMLAEISKLKEAWRENELLREQLDIIPKSAFNLEAGLVIGQSPQWSGSWLIMDKGLSDGIEVGMPAIVSNGILVGKVSETWSNGSKIALLSDSESAVNVMDIETGAKGILRGEYGLGIVMDMVSQNELLNVGDSISTSGLGGDIPSGLLVGKIKEIKISDDKLFQQAIIASPVKYSKLDIVFAIKN